MSTILRFSKIPLRTVRGYTTQLLFQQQRNVTAQSLSVPNERVRSNYTQPRKNVQTTNQQNVGTRKRLPAMNNKQPLELYIANIQKQVYNYEFIDPEEFKKLLTQFQESGFVPHSQILFLLHCCGNYTVLISSEERQKMAYELWSIIKKKPELLDVSLYNALLQIYYENQQVYNPLEILSEMEKNGIVPNRVTFNKIVQHYCRKGDIQTATILLNTMNENNLPLSKSIFNSLIVGHAQSGDVDYSVKLLEIMRKGGLEPDEDTYGALMQAYAIEGNMKKIEEIIMDCEKNGIHLSDSQFMKVVETLAFNGHFQYISKIADTIQMTKKYSMEMIVIMCQLLESNKLESAFELFKVIPLLDTKSRKDVISLFVDKLIEANSPLLDEFCKLTKQNYSFSNIYNMSLRRSYFAKKPQSALNILKKMHQEGDDLEDHYFWPVFSIYKENLDVNGLMQSFETMIKDFGLQPSLKTINTYFISFLSGNMGEIIAKLKSAGIEENRAINAYIYHKLESRNFTTCIYLAQNHPRVALHPMLIIPMKKVLQTFGDAKTFVEFARYVKENHDNKYTLSDGIELFEEEPENVDFNDFVVMQAIEAIPKYKNEVAQKVFNDMLEMGLGISKETAEKIKQHFAKTLRPDMVETLDQLSAGNLNLKPVEYSEEAKTNKRSFDECIKRQEEESALAEIKEMKEKGQEIYPVMYKKLIHLLLKKDKIDEAKEVLDALFQLHGASELEPILTLNYVYTLMKMGKDEEAMNFLTQNYQPDNVADGYDYIQIVRFEKLIAEEIAKLHDDKLEQQFINLFKKQQRIKQVFQPFINVYIARQDYVNALNKLIWIGDLHNTLVSERKLMQCLIKIEDVENLQRLTNYCAIRKGEVQALYDLAIAFMFCGKLNQAKRLLSTPGLRLNINLISQTAQFFRTINKLDGLSDLLEVTKDLENIDRLALFESILNEYSLANDWERGLQLWVQMQEENLIPTDNFLTNLSTLLVKNKQKVPFKMLV